MCILVEKKKKKKFLDFSLRRTSCGLENRVVDHRGYSAARHTNLKFSEASPLCSTHKQTHTHSDTHKHKKCVSQKCFSNIKSRQGAGALRRKAALCIVLTFYFFY